LNIKDVINEFDKTQQEQEEALKNVTEHTEPVEQPGEAKSEGEFVEAPKAEDAPGSVTAQEAQVEADEATEDAEKAEKSVEEGDKSEEHTKADEEVEEAEKSVEEGDKSEEHTKADEEVEEAEKSVEEPVEKAKVAPKKDQKDKEKETDEDVKDSLKDKDNDPKEDGDETDQGKPRKPKKDDKKKTEQVKKSEDELTDMEGLIGVVLKSYQQSVQGQNAMMATITELKAQVETLNAKLEQVTVEEETTSKSILQDETDEDEVEDKAVGYASKNMAPEAEVAVEEDHNNDGEAQPETFVYTQHSQKFMEKFQQDLRTDGLPRRDVDSYRQAFLDASEGNASEYALASLYEYINK